jgi:Tol biopolymer transport system component
MKEHGKESQKHTAKDQLRPEVIDDQKLETRITHFFHEQTRHIDFNPEQRTRIVRQLPSYRITQKSRAIAFTLASAAILVLIVLALWYHPDGQQTAQLATTHYFFEKTVAVAPQLANGGLLISLDPTEQHLVYQAANQPGVMYTADLSNPIASNTLAMRDAIDAAWAPDGSALIATVSPANSSLPLLALVPTGKYMYPLGPTALVASWSPTEKQQISYIIQTAGQTQLWSSALDGHTQQLQTTMPITPAVLHMTWSPDGQQLALIVTTDQALTKEHTGRTLSLMDTKTGQLQTLVPSGNFTLSSIAWSPDGQALAYEQVDEQGLHSIHIIDMTHKHAAASIPLQTSLAGWSWSPDSRAIVYSSAGSLQAYVLRGTQITFPKMEGEQISPFWLKNGSILTMQITQGKGQLVYLTQKAH